MIEEILVWYVTLWKYQCIKNAEFLMAIIVVWLAIIVPFEKRVHGECKFLMAYDGGSIF